MITKLEAINARNFHYGTCTRTEGTRGGIKWYIEHTENWRRNGVTQTWVTRPNDFRVPVKYGLKCYSQITQENMAKFHTVATCPLNDPNYRTSKR